MFVSDFILGGVNPCWLCHWWPLMESVVLVHLVCDVITKRQGLLSSTIIALMWGADPDIKRSAKAGLHALFLLLFLFLLVKGKKTCKYFSVIQKKVCTVLLGGQLLLHFSKKKKSLIVAPQHGMFLFLLLFKIKMYYSLLFADNQSYFFYHTCSLWVDFDGTCIYSGCSDRYCHTQLLHCKLFDFLASYFLLQRHLALALSELQR